ncbi:MFS general substrate transporter [Pleurostoma richardsiae]|uniref:MFS general substrate transporter n=1 Tax=Pleurostoma richardsiae TaxID=41990 RepID=A0AA38VGU9_9PEZI|nr:MFS general substrate transporter [Pleurostoma richardsiae]
MDTSRSTDIVPGTEMVFRTKEEEDNGVDGPRDLILIPAPTDRPDDPLNWSPIWKATVILNQFVFVFVSILTPLSISPLTEIFIAEFHKSLPQVNMLKSHQFGVAAITLGYANFLIVPAANVFGRRPVVIICGLICVLANVWQALVTSYPSFIGARVISGLGAAANESIMPMVVADVLFLHQRGRSMALYFWAYFLGLFIGPIISGSIAAQMNWRWFFWVCTILQGASLLLIVAAFPETKYERSASSTQTPPRQAITSGDDKAVEAQITDASSQGSGPIDATAPSSPRPVGRPSIAQFSLVPRLRFAHGLKPAIRDVISPLRIFAYPIVLWAALSMGFAANSLLALNLTQAQVFAAPPYLFSSAEIGYVNFAFAVGAIVALMTAGPFSDWVALRRARRNGGILEAEMRLPALIPYVCISLVGMVVAAIGYQRSWPWEAIVIVGYGFVGVQVVGIPAIVISYAVDSYRSLPGEIMIAATIVKNTFGFGMVFFFNDWAAGQGFIAPVLTLMTLTVGFSLIGLVVFVPFGKRFRRMTKDSSLHAL